MDNMQQIADAVQKGVYFITNCVGQCPASVDQANIVAHRTILITVFVNSHEEYTNVYILK